MSSQTESPNWVYGTKSSFSAGELTPTIEGRADLPLYQNGAKKIINWMILPSGGVTRRPGTEFIWAKKLVSKTLVSKLAEKEAIDTSVSDSVSEEDSLEDIGLIPVPDMPVPTASGSVFDYGILDIEDELYTDASGNEASKK